MAKTSAQALISDVARRMRYDINDATVRADMLRQLNISQRTLCRDYSLRFLVTLGTLAVVASAAAVPDTIDDGKTMTLGLPSGGGELEYVTVDNWYRSRQDLYGDVTPTEPVQFTIAQVSGALSFIFKPAALSASVPYIAQLRAADMTDAANSYSVLPEGWEDSLLLDHAESEFRRVMNQPQWQELAARVAEGQERLYSSYRTTKEQAMTDREQQERKIAVTKFADEA